MSKKYYIEVEVVEQETDDECHHCDNTIDVSQVVDIVPTKVSVEKIFADNAEVLKQLGYINVKDVTDIEQRKRFEQIYAISNGGFYQSWMQITDIRNIPDNVLNAFANPNLKLFREVALESVLSEEQFEKIEKTRKRNIAAENKRLAAIETRKKAAKERRRLRDIEKAKKLLEELEE